MKLRAMQSRPERRASASRPFRRFRRAERSRPGSQERRHVERQVDDAVLFGHVLRAQDVGLPEEAPVFLPVVSQNGGDTSIPARFLQPFFTKIKFSNLFYFHGNRVFATDESSRKSSFNAPCADFHAMVRTCEHFRFVNIPDHPAAP